MLPETFKVYLTRNFFSSVFENLVCIENDTKLKSCLKFLKTSFFAGKRPYFSLQNCPGDWNRIYRIATSIDLIEFPRTQCFCYKSLKMLTLFSSIGDLLETSKNYSEKEQVEKKWSCFRSYQTRQRRTFTMSSLLSCCGEDVDVKVVYLSWLYISGSTSVVRFLCWVLLGFIKNIKALVFT